MTKTLQIEPEIIPMGNGRARIDSKADGVYVVSGGSVLKYPLPDYGTIKIKIHDSKIDHPEYTIHAGN
ncbi:MAG: hypothetical protein LKI80_07375 [Sporolactobacillus sp.]|nr:hypothetical protein [Sporolactobacillus sp.]